MDGGGAYGAGKSGANFNPVEFIKRPKTILRILSWVFAIIVFGCIVSEGYHKHGICIFNDNINACHYGVAIGILGFIGATVFFVVDLIFPSISSASKRKKLVMADMFFCGLWTFMFFVGFCFLTNTWMKTVTQSGYGAGNARAAITFSFFSILSWGGLTYLSVMDYRQGALSAFAPTYSDPTTDSSAPYSSFPGEGGGESYQQPPFTQNAEPSSQYQPPSY